MRGDILHFPSPGRCNVLVVQSIMSELRRCRHTSKGIDITLGNSREVLTEGNYWNVEEQNSVKENE